VRDVLGVILDPAEQRRAPGVLPGQSKEVEARRRRDAAPVHQAAVLVEHRRVDPRVVEAKAGRPYDNANVEFRPVIEAHRRSGAVDGSSVELNSVPATVKPEEAKLARQVIQTFEQPLYRSRTVFNRRAFIITAYEPSLDIFESDYRTRKK